MTTIEGTAEATFEADWQKWHTDRVCYFGQPLGWVSITGLYWLTDEFESVADLPGRWRADADATYVEGIEGTERLEPVEGAPGLLVAEGLEHHHTAVGVIDFELAGAAGQLVAFGRTTGGLHVLFTDATSGVTTYPGARSLALDTPGTDGSVTLDFNRAANLPCSFTDFATCPVAPADNHLTIAVEAGEKNPR